MKLMSDEEAPWPRGLFAPSPVSVPDEAPSLYAEIERLREEVAELAEENALIRKLANKYLAENTAIKEEVERMREALEKIGGLNGPYSAQWPESEEGYASFAVVTSREALTPSQEPRT
jgi:chromosome segregation ATPase